ncbi:AAA family ATPase [Streptomyces sp. NPDC001530]|uniref:ATP-binding protein n=1 Tax=Streptomyces sp. NPDC001530 TaxID=3364582 RepID=UPI0036B93D94
MQHGPVFPSGDDTPGGRRYAGAGPVPTAGATLPGRSRELLRIQELLATGEPAFVVVTGEPGIGKSRLLSRVPALAPAGVPVLSGRAHERESTMPWALVSDALDGVEDIAGGGGPGASARSSGSSGTGRSAGSARGGRPQAPQGVLLLDDVHWADAASVEFVDYVVRHPVPGSLLTALAARTDRLPALVERFLGCAAVPVARLPLGPVDPAYRHNVAWQAGYRHPRHNGGQQLVAALQEAFAERTPCEVSRGCCPRGTCRRS